MKSDTSLFQNDFSVDALVRFQGCHQMCHNFTISHQFDMQKHRSLGDETGDEFPLSCIRASVQINHYVLGMHKYNATIRQGQTIANTPSKTM